MRVRSLDAAGNPIYGKGTQAYAQNSAQAVALAIESRARMWLSEWFIDLSDGTDWANQVLGYRTEATREPMLRARILGTPGVTSIESFSASVNRATRIYSFTARVNTVYGTQDVSADNATMESPT